MKLDKNQKKIALLISFFVLGIIVTLILRPSYLLNILIVYAIPAGLNFYWLKQSRKKVLIFSLITTILFAVPVEIISRLANAWDVQSTLPRIMDIAPLENLLYAFINFFWPLSFYELFIDHDADSKFSNRWKYLIGIYVIFSAFIYSFLFINREIITLDYWKVALFVLLIPSLLIFSRRPRLIKKAFGVMIFFGLIFFLHEALSMHLGHWWWPGEYLATMKFMGQTFPLDDVLIWYLLSTPALIGGYEFFMDDFE
ncbi:MAG: hypothetical protein WCV50_01025 [Patescibacteria group bacterium]|jgi:hypothetical protein